MAISSPGIGSNLDVNGIVSQLMALERRPLQALDRKEASFQSQLSAFGTLKGALSKFQEAVHALNDVDRFQAYKASVLDSAVATASAADSAAPGSYSLEVTQLARAQKLVALGQASATSTIGSGAVTLEFGTISGGTFDSVSGHYTGASFTPDGAGAKSITIGASNNTLAGIRDAINAAKLGVTASIVNDGSGTPYRLALSVNDTGAARSLRISVTGDAALSSLLAHDPAGTQNLAQTAPAADALFKVDGVAVSKSKNTITDVIEGVTLNLTRTNAGAPTEVGVVRDSGAIKGSVEALVKAYNELDTTLRNLSAYDPATKRGSVLQGDVTLITLQSRIRATLSNALQGVAGGFDDLSEIGVAFQKSGALTLDAAKFQSALDAAPNDIAALFAALGKPSDAAVAYVSATDATRPGEYALNVTRLATQGTQAGSAAAGLTITAGVNDAFTINVDGESAAVTLAAGTYASAAALAREVQSKVNGAGTIAAAGASVAVSESAGVLTLTSARYGSASSVQISSGNALADLLGAAPVASAGADVEGTLGGVAASGSGRFLTDLSSGPSSGLKIEVTGGALGDRGKVNFSRGYAATLDKLVEDFLASDGAIAARTEGINASIKTLDNRRDEMERRLQDVETRIRAQFTALDTLLGRMSATSTFLTQQLAKLDAQTK
ncbi:MAG: flagellar filament capping protein FliD [Burkholderiales bacterium]|nr:flagellar filament capping protein FliD [Burkholderiales bacterium]